MVTPKPQITFFGEELPKKYFDRLPNFDKANLLIVLGTSLSVTPFCYLINKPKESVLKLLINNEKVGEILKHDVKGFDFSSKRDFFYSSETDDGIREIVNKMKWESEYNEIVNEKKE